MSLSPDEATDNLRRALLDHAEAHDLMPDYEVMLDQFAVVCSWMRLESNGTTTYTTHFHREEVPTHIAVGLLRTAEHLILKADTED